MRGGEEERERHTDKRGMSVENDKVRYRKALIERLARKGGPKCKSQKGPKKRVNFNWIEFVTNESTKDIITIILEFRKW